MASDDLAQLKQQRDAMERDLSLLKARIDEAEGKPCAARFQRICAHAEQGSVQDAYVAMRAEQIIQRGYVYDGDDDETKAAAQAAAQRMRGTKGGNGTIDLVAFAKACLGVQP